VVSNTPLSAQLSIATNASPVSSNFSVTVTANTNSVSQILLFTTGGFLQGATNLSSKTFSVSGQPLAAGEHPFYAMVITSDGLRYRTETRRVTLFHP